MTNLWRKIRDKEKNELKRKTQGSLLKKVELSQDLHGYLTTMKSF